MVLEARGICKSIKKHKVIDGVSLRMESGNVYCFVGSNGCGKTMLFRALSGLISVDNGMILLDGKQLKIEFSVLPSLGIVLENVGLYPDLTGYDNLKQLAGIKKIADNRMIAEALERVGLDPKDKRIYRKYSLGMKQKLALAQAIMEKPDVIILDEPTNALDEAAIHNFYQIVREEKQRGALILIASHSRNDISELADMIYKVKDGKVFLHEE